MFSPLARARPGWPHNRSPALWPQFFLRIPRARVRHSFDSSPNLRSPGPGLSREQRQVRASKSALSFAGAENNRTNDNTLWRFGKAVRQIIERSNFLAVYFIHNPAAVRREIRIDRVRQNIG